MQASDIFEEVDPKTGITLSRYVKGKLLGKGGFAKCFEATECETGRIYAAKIIEKKTLIKPKTQQKLKSEIKIHSGLRHQQIVKFEKYFEDRENVYILLEVCSNQTLMELQRRKRRLTEPEAAFIMLQTLSGVKYMHDKNIIHRDLKLGNLFLNNKMEVKIGDFGLAAQLEFDGERKLTVCGTPNYIAPEILDGGKHGHSFEVDIWSLGVIMFTLLVGKPPFETNDVKATYRKIRNINYAFPDGVDISPAAKNLIQRILQSCPESRPTLCDLQNDAWFRNMEIPKYAPYTLFPHGPERQYAQDRNLREMQEKESYRPRRASDTLCVAASMQPSMTFETKREPLKPINGYEKFSPRSDVISPRASCGSPKAQRSNLERDAFLRRYNSEKIPGDGFAKPAFVPPICQKFVSVNQPNYGFQVPVGQPMEIIAEPKAECCNNNNMEVIANGRDLLDEEEKANLTNMHQNLSVCIQPGADVLSSNDNYNLNGIKPSVWVTEYSDFTSKYGLAYKMSSGQTGAAFNDGTKMVWDSTSGVVEYISRNKDIISSVTKSNEERVVCSVTEYPEALKKKITLITYFKSYFAKYKGKNVAYQVVTANPNTNETEKPTARNSEQQPGVFVKQWMKHSHAMVFRLSNKCFQVAFFDGSDILLSSEARLVTYTDQSGISRTFALEMGKIPHKDVAARLEYTQKILHEIMHK